MAIIGNLPGDRLAGLTIDMLQKIRNGGLTLAELEMFTKRKNPFVFERNEHGHTIMTVTGLDLTGAQEIERLEASGSRFSKWAKSCLLSTASGSYDTNHRLVTQEYKIALMPTKEIEVDVDRTTEHLRERGLHIYGYDKPLGGIIPRIREEVSDKRMEEMGFYFIVAPHDPIDDSDGGPVVLGADRDGGGRWVSAYVDRPVDLWGVSGAFAFLVPASVPLAPPS